MPTQLLVPTCAECQGPLDREESCLVCVEFKHRIYWLGATCAQPDELIPMNVRLLQDLLNRIEKKRATKKGIQPADSRLLLQATKALATLLDASRKHDRSHTM